MINKVKKKMTRSENMSKVKSKGNNYEIYLRKLLWKNGFRYRVNYTKLPGKPDIYIMKYKTAIFVNGCFWHMHNGCKLSTVPKSNYDFWNKKLKGNVIRDNLNYDLLKSLGINIIIVWGCEIKEMMKNSFIEKEKILSIKEICLENCSKL